MTLKDLVEICKPIEKIRLLFYDNWKQQNGISQWIH